MLDNVKSAIFRMALTLDGLVFGKICFHFFGDHSIPRVVLFVVPEMLNRK